MTKALLIPILSICIAGCASERISVTVRNNEGCPVSNAVVRVGYSSGHIVFAEQTSHHAEAKTDEHGKAIVRFNCSCSDVYWSAKAEGYYPSDFHKEVFLIEVIPIPPVFYKVNMLEHEKEGKVVLWKKRNPQPMIAHGVGYEKDEHPVPRKNGRYGFDMMKYDWLPPLGKGEVADFYFGEWGWLEFPEKCGMYTGKQTGCKNFPSTYGADTNAVYKSRIPFIFDHADDGKKGITYKDIVNEDEYGVLRTRVVCDARGNIIKANYSKVLGPFRFGEWCGKWVILTRCAVFNPRVNDPNLESDPEHSYDPKVKRPLLAP